MSEAALRVLHLDLGRRMRGGQWQVLLLAEELRGKIEQTVMAPAGSPLLDAARAAGIPTREAGWGALWREARRAGVVHAHDAKAHSWAAMLARRPVVVSRRVVFPVSGSALSRWKYGRAAAYLAISEAVRKQLILAGVADEKIQVVPDAVRVPASAVTQDWKRIVALESDDPGKCGPLVREAARLAGVRVCFSRDLPRDLDGAGIFVYLSESEGLGSAARLAMARGAAVIASRVGGLTEVVLDGRTGILTENRPEEVASALRRLMEDPALAARMGAEGRERAAEVFSPERMAQATLSVYGSVCGRPPA